MKVAAAILLALLIIPAAAFAFEGGSCLASSSGSGSPALIIDNDPATVWGASSGAFPQWIIYDAGAGLQHRATSYTIGRGASNATAPSSIKLQASIDASHWIDLDARLLSWIGSPLNQTVAGLDNPAAYRFYRLEIAATEGGGLASIGEWTMKEDLEENQTALVFASRPFGGCIEVIDSSNKHLGVYTTGDRISVNTSRDYTILVHPSLASESNNILGILERCISWIKANFPALFIIALLAGFLVWRLRRR